MRTGYFSLVVGSLLLFSSQSQAAIIKFNEIGTVKSGTDNAGLFGAPGQDLAGQSFSAIATFDTTNASSGIYGGSGFGLPNSATNFITVGNSAPVSVYNEVSLAFANSNSETFSITHGFRDGSGNLLSVESFDILIVPNMFSSNVFNFGTSNNSNALIYSSFQYNDVVDPSKSESIVFNVSSVNVSAVPLPASAPMFGAALLGLTGLGYAAKRKKAAAAA